MFKVKYNLKDVEFFVKNKGGILLSTEYKNSHSKLKVRCNNGHVFEPTFTNLKVGTWCKVCSGYMKKTIDEVVKFIQNKGGILLSTEYKNNHSKLEVLCEKNHYFKASFQKIIQNKWCPYCVGKYKTIEDVKKIIELEEGYFLISKIYKNAVTKLEFLCKKNHYFKSSFNNFQQGKRCPECSNFISKSETAWLNYLHVSKEYRQSIIYVNSKKFKSDAYNPITNTIYEFYGDYWHGNPNNMKYSSEKIHPLSKKTYSELYQKTLEKERILKEAGYNIISIWESDWNKLKKEI